MSGQIQPAEVNQRIEAALGMNEWLASCYHSKNPSIPRDEFLSQGLMGIERANRKFRAGNWHGYVKVAIQNEMRGICRKQKRRTELFQKAYRIYDHYHYIVRAERETFIISSNTRYRDPRTGWFITEKKYRILLQENYKHAQRKNGHLGGK